MIDFFVKYRLIISILFYLLGGSGFFGQVFNMDEEPVTVLKWICRFILFIFWVTILVDMITHKIKDKTFWILSMFILVIFAPVVYLFRRKNLLNLQNNKFRNS